MRHIAIFGFVVLLSACLQTREVIQDGGGEEATVRGQMKALQARSAQQELRLDEILTELRSLNGRLDQLERRGGAPSGEGQQDLEQIRARLKIYEEALQKLDQEVQSVRRGRSGAAFKPESSKVPSGDLAAGDYYFDQKIWSDAIRSYESYRQKNPQSKNYPKATLRIALSFQSMGMNSEAKAFFQEVADRFPSTDESRIATSRLSQL